MFHGGFEWSCNSCYYIRYDLQPSNWNKLVRKFTLTYLIVQEWYFRVRISLYLTKSCNPSVSITNFSCQKKPRLYLSPKICSFYTNPELALLYGHMLGIKNSCKLKLGQVYNSQQESNLTRGWRFTNLLYHYELFPTCTMLVLLPR